MKVVDRRAFLLTSGVMICRATMANAFWPFGRGKGQGGGPDIHGMVFKGDAPDKPWKWSKEGYHYTKIFDNKVVCGICPHQCVLEPGDRSVCRSRVNIGGTLYTLTYGDPCAVHLDPVEKKPLFHFKPSTTAFSIATTGCNFRCLNCQNWEISQAKPNEVRHAELFPEDVVADAKKAKAASIAYTYSEASTFYEYMIDTARIAKRKGISNLWISNGYMNSKPLKELLSVIDGANVNLKSFSDEIYRKLNGGRLKPVLNTFKTMHKTGVHFEMTNLVVPGYTDDDEMMKKMCGWILENLGEDHPLHFLRFFPKYKLDRLPATPVSTLTRFRKTAIEMGVRYVYVGNVPGHEGNNTYCHHCGKLLIERTGYFIPVNNIENGRCVFCGTKIPGVWG